MKSGPFIITTPLLLLPLVLHADGPSAHEGASVNSLNEIEHGGDGDPGVYDEPAPALTHPVRIALDLAPRCGAPPDWAQVMDEAGVNAQTLRTAIRDGTVGLSDLGRAIGALSAIGSEDDLRTLWEGADDLGWEYVVDAVDALATDAEVFAAQASLAGSSRRDILVAWAEREDLPDDILDAALADPDARVRRNAARIALASANAGRIEKGLDACASDPAVASVFYICP